MSATSNEISITDKFIASLTRNSGELLDWHNVGGLAKQRTKESYWGLWANYNWRELAIRGSMIIFTGYCLYVGANSCDNDMKEACSPWMRGVVGGVFGFFASHAVAVYPTVMRRNQIKQKTLEVKQEINSMCVEMIRHNKLDDNEESLQQIVTLIKQRCQDVINMELPLKSRADNARNLVFRKKSMKMIKDILSEQMAEELSLEKLEEYNHFWSLPIAELITVVATEDNRQLFRP